MLRALAIRNFVVVDELEAEFARGFTVLTGETGAGKSILIEALGLLLGDRFERPARVVPYAARVGGERACSTSRTSTPTTGTATSSRASPWASAPARSSASSGAVTG